MEGDDSRHNGAGGHKSSSDWNGDNAHSLASSVQACHRPLTLTLPFHGCTRKDDGCGGAITEVKQATPSPPPPTPIPPKEPKTY
jgi:hypothetical protein